MALLDVHSTRYQLEVIKSRENKLLILNLSPHATPATQPLDCGVCLPLKT